MIRSEGERPPGQGDTAINIDIPRPIEFYPLSFFHDRPMYI